MHLRPSPFDSAPQTLPDMKFSFLAELHLLKNKIKKRRKRGTILCSSEEKLVDTAAVEFGFVFILGCLWFSYFKLSWYAPHHVHMPLFFTILAHGMLCVAHERAVVAPCVASVCCRTSLNARCDVDCS